MSAAHRLCLVVVLLSVICAQSLGFMHAVAHPAPDTAHGDVAHAALDAESSPHAHDWLEALFAEHDDTQDCRVYDALGQQAPVAHLPVFLPVLVPSPCAHRSLHGAFVARWAALFDARGPPLSR